MIKKPFLCRTIGSNRRLEQMGRAAVSNCHWLIHGLLDFLDGIHTMSLSQFRGDTDLSDGRLAQPKARRARPRQVQSTCEQHIENDT